MSEIAALQKYSCPACGAEAVWNAAKQALGCPYCGMESETELASDGSLIKEHPLATALRALPGDQRGWEAGRTPVQCQSCKAISLFEEQQVASRCEFCASPAVVPYQATRSPIHPGSLIPFKQSEGAVREKIRAWYKGRWFAPNKLKSRALTDTVHGLYIPYWTFDARAHADWSAESGYYYYVNETYRDSKGQTQTRRVRKVRWESSSGNLDHFFDDELVPATKGVDLRLLKRIQSFPASALVPFDTGYVSGWVVEQYQIDLISAAATSREQMEKKLTALCSAQVPGDTHRGLSVDSEYTEETFKHILAPIWLLSYTFGRRNFQVVVNGFDGSMAGDYPKSWIKITLAVLALIVGVLLLIALLMQ